MSANTTSRMESSANGMTFFGKVISLFFGVLFIVIEIFARKVRLKPLLNTPLLNTLLDQNFQAQEVKPNTLTAAFYLFSAALPASTCSWVLCNREAQAFLLRKIGCSKANNTVAATRTTPG